MVYDPLNDYIWLVARNALCYYDLRRSAFAEFSPRIPGCLGACRVDDKLWVSSIEGLRVIDLKTLEFRTIAGFPMSMALVPDGDSIWAGTYGSGIYRLDNCQAEEPEITIYSEEDGLCDDQINGLLLDGMYLWITTENGLSRLDTQTGELTRPSKARRRPPNRQKRTGRHPSGGPWRSCRIRRNGRWPSADTCPYSCS